MQDLAEHPSRLRPLAAAPATGLLLHEIYASIQGESSWAGLPCIFIRTTACNLRCSWCDTPHAFAHGAAFSLDEIMRRVAACGVPLVEITGGEPLLQPNVLQLMRRLCDAGYTVLLETSGSLPIGAVDPRVARIVDFKAPGSGECAANCLDNIALLGPRDEVKLVLADAADYAWAKSFMQQHALAQRCTVLLSCVHGRLAPSALAKWILADRLPARLQVQLHKYIWDADARGV